MIYKDNYLFLKMKQQEMKKWFLIVMELWILIWHILSLFSFLFFYCFLFIIFVLNSNTDPAEIFNAIRAQVSDSNSYSWFLRTFQQLMLIPASRRQRYFIFLFSIFLFFFLSFFLSFPMCKNYFKYLITFLQTSLLEIIKFHNFTSCITKKWPKSRYFIFWNKCWSNSPRVSWTWRIWENKTNYWRIRKTSCSTR